MGIKSFNEEQAVLLAQKIWRGRQVRKKFEFRQAPVAQLTHGPTFIVGSDPKIDRHELKKFATQQEKIALVGTSGLRSLSLICDLGDKTHIPKLIIVDNSIKVIEFWRKLRAMVTESVFVDKEYFIRRFQDFLTKNAIDSPPDNLFNDLNPAVQYENQNPLLFMRTLIEEHGLDRIVSILKHTTIIGQDWRNTRLFSALKNIFDLNGIKRVYAYPSNIGSCVHELDRPRLVKNITLIDPELAVVSDRSPALQIPLTVYLKPWTKYQRKSEAVKKVLEEFQSKIATIGNNYPQAKEVALKLYDSLQRGMTDAFTNPNRQKIDQFVSSSKESIQSATSELQKDLSWGDYLLNLIKRIVNAVVNEVNFGHKKNFFNTKPVEAVKVANQVGEQLHAIQIS